MLIMQAEKLKVLDSGNIRHHRGRGFCRHTWVQVSLTYVEASYNPTERKTSSTPAKMHYITFGGVPNAIVTDNLKSAVTKSNRYEPTLNEAFRDFVSYYSMAALPAAPYKPKHKALVEGAVKIIYRSIYSTLKGNVYSCIELLNSAIREALEAHNNRPLTRKAVQQTTVVRRY